MIPNIALVGFMGCGKTSVGRCLAARTGYDFVDTDDLVAEKAGKPVAEIFSAEGEGAFRVMEREVLQGLVGRKRMILSTGGGLILEPVNREALRRMGIVAWLDADPDLLFERASRSGRRPLLQTDTPKESFHQLLESRIAIYSDTSDFRVDSTALDHTQTAEAILESLGRHPRRFAFDETPA